MIEEFSLTSIGTAFLDWSGPVAIERAQNLIQTRNTNPDLEDPEQHRNYLQSFKTSFQEGMASFFQGTLPRMIAFIPVAATPLLADYFQEKYNLQPRMAGVVANTITYLVRYPFDYAFTKLATQSREGEYKGIWDLFKKRVKKDGFLSLYNGMMLSLLGIVVSHIAGVGVVVALRLKPSYTAINFRRLMFALTIRVSLYPFDTIRKRLIVSDTHPDEKKRGYKNPVIFKDVFTGFSYSFITGVYTLTKTLIYSAQADREAMAEFQQMRKERESQRMIENIKARAHSESMRDIYRRDGKSGLDDYEDNDE